MNPVEKQVLDDLNDLDDIALNWLRTKDSESNDPNGVDDDGDYEIWEALPRITADKFFELLSLIRLFEVQQVDWTDEFWVNSCSKYYI